MKKKNKQLVIIYILCIVGLLSVSLPLLILGHYNYPSADDWSLGLFTHQAVENHKGPIGVLIAAVKTTLHWRIKGEPRFMNAFLGALQPGILGEGFYALTAWIMIGSIVFSELFFSACIFCNEDTRKWVLPVTVPSMLVQLLCVPYPVETFYWYVGAVNYTFIFSASLVLYGCFYKLWQGEEKKRFPFYMAAGILTAIIVGGDSYNISLSCVCLFCFVSALLLFKNKKALLRTLPLTVTVTVCLIICLCAPGNMARVNVSYGGKTNGAVSSVLMSLTHTLSNIYNWTDFKIIFMLLLVAPFLWMALQNTKLSFKYPLLFTIVTYGVYASQIAANMYVEGGIAARRVADILYYGYHLFIMVNAAYWIGWIQRRKKVERISEEIETYIAKYAACWFVAVGILLVAVIGLRELKVTSTYRAFVWLAKGYAKEYAASWQERLVLLRDDTVEEAYFEPLPGYEEMIFYADLLPQDAWINDVCAEYYGKKAVGIKEE